MPRDGVVSLMIDQVTEAQTEQPDLELVLDSSGRMIVQGTLRFCIEHDGRTFKDAYQVELTIPSDYPDSPPTIRETGSAIPDDFHKFPKTGNLCLGAPVEVRRVFAQGRTLLSFINRLVVPYLFSHSYFRDHGELPHGDLSHGMLGLLEYYKEFFSASALTVMKLLKLLADDLAPPLMRCPCGSGKTLQDCHGPKLDELRSHYPANCYAAELREMVTTAAAAGIRLPDRDVMPKRMWKNRQKRRKKEGRCR